MAAAADKEVEKVKKITRRDAAQMSTEEFMRNSKVPFKRLLSYVKPYRFRFGLGILFGIFFGLFNAGMLFVIKFAIDIALPQDDERVEIQLPTDPAQHVIRVYPENATPDAKLLQEIRLPEVDGGSSYQIRLPAADYISLNVPGVKKAVHVPKPSLDKDGSLWVVVGLCLFIPLTMLLRGGLNYLSEYCMLWVGMRVLFDIRSQLFRRMMDRSQGFFNQQKTGELIQTTYNQSRMAAQAGTDLAASLVKSPVSIIGIVIVLFLMDWRFAICSLVIFPLCMAPVLIISKKVRSSGGKEEQEAGMIMVVMQEAFAGFRVVKSHAREEYESERFDRTSAKLNKTIMRWRKAQLIAAPLVETVASLGIAAGLVYAWKTEMPASQFLILYLALISIYPHAKNLSQVQLQLQKCLVASTKVFSIMDTDLEIADIPDAEVLKDVKGAIELRNVTFSYKVGKELLPALHKVSLKLEPGKSYALVGESGAGKSTIFSLLMRFYDPQHGKIFVDGHDIKTVTQRSLRDHIGVVNQDAFLFHDSVMSNIRYGKLDATDEEIFEASRAAHAEEFILDKEHGYDEVVGDSGSKVSGGQRQRITIARAFVRNAPILLLDEATSALDSQSEQVIHQALEDLSKGKTVIAIAHRLSTILNSDAIVMMHEGKVLDVGPHHELLERCEEYRHLYELQFRKSEGHEAQIVRRAQRAQNEARAELDAEIITEDD